jgi:ribonuclease P protein component
MGKSEVISLTENYEFGRVYKRGVSYAGRFVVIYVWKKRVGDLRLGITVTKKVGKACVRNRSRRLIYENMRLVFPNLKENYDIVTVARQSTVGADFWSVGKDIKKLLQKAQMFK